MLKDGDHIKYRRNGMIYEGVVYIVNKMSKDGEIVITLKDGIQIFIRELIEHPYDITIEHPYDITMEELKKKEDNVNHPKHYTFGKIEVITVIDDWQLGFYEGQVIKYVGRAKHKGNELEDLRKAQWYLNRKIKQLSDEVISGKEK